MQWMTITSFAPCYAPNVPQHVVVSVFGQLNQIMISSAPSAETVTHVSVWSFLLLAGLQTKAKSSIYPSLCFV